MVLGCYDRTVTRFPILQPADLVRFQCTECGECCFDQTVALEPQDVFRLSRAARTTSGALIDAGAITIAEDGGCSLVMRRLNQKTTMCPHLQPVIAGDAPPVQFRCALHARGAKPLVCRSSPIARTVSGSLHLVPPVEGCPGMERGAPRPVHEMLPCAEDVARSQWFHATLRPLLGDREVARRAFDFDRRRVLADLAALDLALGTLADQLCRR